MTSRTGPRHIPDHIRAAAIADHRATGDPYKVVAARHGVSRAALHSWVNPSTTKRAARVYEESEVAYVGGWINRGGVMYPLVAERRTA